jgi:hypothetical protein
MAGYAKTPLSKKLGIRAGDRVLLLGPPPAWAIPDLPEGAMPATETHSSAGSGPAEIVIAFCSSLAELRERVPLLAPRIFPAGALWVAWPRRAGGHDSDIRDQDIRDVALPLGLVDVKVAALDQDWSGLRLVWRVELRDTSQPPSG